MKINLRGLIMNLTKNNEDVTKSSFLPGKIRQIEREMEVEKKKKTGELTTRMIIDRLKDEEKLRKALSDGEWKMIEREVEKMLK